ncbi:MAG: M48 family metallopeptidase [Prevotella sp.]|nr:M48 family metallopeptidase [Prevotella sp.]
MRRIQSLCMMHYPLCILLAALLLVSCGTTSRVPVTGRKQTLMVSDGDMLSLSTQQYQQFMQSARPSTNASATAMVKRVGQNLANAVTTYLQQNGYAAEVQHFAWEFNLVQDPQVNAWCMPGGKIVVYEGLLPVTQDEASLAIVLGHEIAHAVAKHSAERISKEYKNQYGAAILGTVVQAAGVSQGTQQLIDLVQQVGGSLLTSGFSRKQESEADHMGLIFAAMAGYDPRVATTFWQRMAAQGSGGGGLFSDHPSDADRVRNIQGWMPEALRYYKGGTTTATPANTSRSFRFTGR